MSTKYLTTEQAAELAGVRPKTLVMMRYEGRGPRYVKLSPGRSGRVRYPEAAVIAWLKAREQGGDGEAA
ncbi:helix-turn-helix domain-containing protein [Streptomonospora sp. PA3]|uniref:helix-turn-helix transcriptional regulator n=1 Tax=Streptomonospora sp. PA3 TaxID=2607326 RepID=UPI0012DBE2FF|nr:helix-turn-helix domain-containing protein [Streptomonospora sp. PA3]MUL39713.1 helix-turn-helix domain-containing protein [Streptomonospora sp. PA3]